MINEFMFCPKCGKADQSPETFCRQCGQYLQDYEKSVKKKIQPEEHLKANLFLNLLTALTSLTLAILLYSIFLGKEDTPVIIYVTAGFLTAMTAWQVQTFWRTILLRKHFKKRNAAQKTSAEIQAAPYLESKPTNELLPEADFKDYVPASVVEKTTRKLKVKSKK
jgi:hypothetical protein